MTGVLGKRDRDDHRAMAACETCRRRKRRCDEQQPCSVCADAKQECIYTRRAPNRMTSTNSGGLEARIDSIQDRLTQLENALGREDRGSHRLSDAHEAHLAEFRRPSGPHQHQRTSTSSHSNIESISMRSPVSTKSTYSKPPSVMDDSVPSESNANNNMNFLIPLEHETSTNWLLSRPTIREQIGAIRPGYLHQVEKKNELPQKLCYGGKLLDDGSHIGDKEALVLIEAYFNYANLFYPVLSAADRRELVSRHEGWQKPRRDLLDTGLGLIVCALGELSFNDPTREDNASRLFAAGLQKIDYHYNTNHDHTIKLAKAEILAASFFAYRGLPLYSWRRAQTAFAILRENLSPQTQKNLEIPKRDQLPSEGEPHDPGDHQGPEMYSRLMDSIDGALRSAIDDEKRRIYWSCLLIECDRLAELELPRSGIDKWSDRFPVPSDHSPENHLETKGFCFEIEIRKLLNRVHFSFYDKYRSSNDNRPDTLNNVTDSLKKYVQVWREQNIKEMAQSEAVADRVKVLDIRYYAAMHIIHRPHLLFLDRLRDPTSFKDLDARHERLLAHAKECVEAIKCYLERSTALLQKRTPYLWTMSISSVGALLVLSIANKIPRLRYLIAHDLERLQQTVIDRLSTWATPGSSLEAAREIVTRLRDSELRSPR